MTNYNLNSIDELFDISKKYAIDNNISSFTNNNKLNEECFKSISTPFGH